MSKPRIDSVRLVLPSGEKPGQITVTLVTGRSLSFPQGQMLSVMRAKRMMYLKVRIIHDMAFEQVQLLEGSDFEAAKELLLEFYLAGIEYGAKLDITRKTPKF